MTDHQPDRSKLPKVLQSLPWLEYKQSDEFCDGMQLLCAVPVCIRDGHRSLRLNADTWRYEMAVVTVRCDEHYFMVEVDGEPWGWEIYDVDFYLVLRD